MKMLPHALSVFVFVCALSAMVACTPTKDDGRDEAKEFTDYLALGAGYMRNGEYQRAKEYLNRAQAMKPKSAEVHSLFGLLFQLEGEDALAEDHFKAAIKQDPQSTRSRNNYGAFLFSEERYDEAVGQLEVAAKDLYYPGRAQVFENLGVSYARLGKMKPAEEAFVRAIDLNGGQPRALVELAEIRFRQRDYVGAKELFERHIKRASQTPRSLWLGIRIARIFSEDDAEASYGLLLRNIFPASEEYQRYMESLK